jgi:hypothetical protein
MDYDLTRKIVSPDGRFEVSLVDTTDRYTFTCDTVLTERATGNRLFSCQGAPQAEFAADGLLAIHYPGYEPGGVRIDPARGVFRTHESQPWVPLTAWPLVESAYGRGWAQAMDYRNEDKLAIFPWSDIAMMLASFAALPILVALPFRMGIARWVLLFLAGLGVLFFGYLITEGVKAWTKGKQWERRLNAEGRFRQFQSRDSDKSGSREQE